ncbi:MAG: hypothetical protein WBW89_03460 [Candidatus Cybelea sp.]
MRLLLLRKLKAFASVAAAIEFAACGGPQPEPGLTLQAQSPVATVIDDRAFTPDRGASWMAPAAKSSSLLYVSDLGTFDVNVYAFPSLKPAGKLTGFNEPQGECGDAKGNIWITSTGNQTIYKYAHGATQPSALLSDPLGSPIGCAVNPASEDLAIANFTDFSGGGSVLVYKHARGSPAAYSNPKQLSNYFAAYDGKGDLYVSGVEARTRSYMLSVLPHGRTAMSSVAISGGALYFPGTVAWHGSTLVLGDQKCKKKASSCLYELHVSGATAKITGTTALTGACDVAQAWVGKAQLAGGDYRYCGGGSSVDIWRFPSGGNPTAKVGGLQIPVGATVSAPSGANQLTAPFKKANR